MFNKQFLFFSLFSISNFLSFCQQANYKHPSALGIHFILNDFKSGSIFHSVNNMDAGLSLNYLQGMGAHFDWMILLSGSFPDSANKITTAKNKALLLEESVLLRARLIGKNNWINPYLFTGIGASQYRNNFGSFISAGLGIEFNYRDVYFMTSAGYNFSLIPTNLSTHYNYSIGIAGLILKPKKKKIIEPVISLEKPIARDRDGDGIVDSLDQCPDTPGLAKFQGCPDTDGDGIPDKDDKCPLVFGYARYQGCPIPDTDKDGVNDEEDSCITTPGPKSNHGCPIVKKEVKEKIDLAAKNIFFKTGSYELLSKSFTSLDEVVTLLNQNPTVKLIIEGHTDNQGTQQSNQILSENRAMAVMDYLLSKGIGRIRLQSFGYGQSMPVDTNKTPKGRARNRRVEFKIIQLTSRR